MIDVMMIAGIQQLWMKRKAWIVVIVLLGSGAVLGAVRYTNRSPAVPIFEVKRGEMIASVHLRGEIKALKSVTSTAPAEVGDLQIKKLAPDGTQVKQGDVVVEF